MSIEKRYRQRTKDEIDNYIKGMEEVADVLDNLSVSWILACGALLGIHREGNLISYDCDVDIEIGKEDFEKRNEIKQKLKEKGFGVDMWDVIITMRGRKYDHKYELRFWELEDGKRKRKGFTLPDKFFKNKGEIELRGRKYPCPKDVEGYLEYVYGKNWKVPYKIKKDYNEGYTQRYSKNGYLQE